MPRARNTGRRLIRNKENRKKDDGTRVFLKSPLTEIDLEFIKGHKVGFWKGIFIGILVGILITVIISGIFNK